MATCRKKKLLGRCQHMLPLNICSRLLAHVPVHDKACCILLTRLPLVLTSQLPASDGHVRRSCSFPVLRLQQRRRLLADAAGLDFKRKHSNKVALQAPWPYLAELHRLTPEAKVPRCKMHESRLFGKQANVS